MTISVLTPDRKIFVGIASRLTLPGTDGTFQLLDNHAPLVSSLRGGRVAVQASAGEYTYYDESKDEEAIGTESRNITFTIDGGFVEVLNNEVNLLVQGARNMR
jgi:F-type H+-transporting ATPase subunit epsilon